MYYLATCFPSSSPQSSCFQKEPHLKVLRETRAKEKDREGGGRRREAKVGNNPMVYIHRGRGTSGKSFTH